MVQRDDQHGTFCNASCILRTRVATKSGLLERHGPSKPVVQQ
jgi:hypothetical protein